MKTFTTLLIILFISLKSTVSWGMSSTFVCNPWTYDDGSKSDESFIIEIVDDILIENKIVSYRRVTDGGSSIIYILDDGYPFTLFIHDGDKGFIPHGLVHSNSNFYLTGVDDPFPNIKNLKFFSTSKQTRCKKF